MLKLDSEEKARIGIQDFFRSCRREERVDGFFCRSLRAQAQKGYICVMTLLDFVRRIFSGNPVVQARKADQEPEFNPWILHAR